MYKIKNVFVVFMCVLMMAGCASNKKISANHFSLNNLPSNAILSTKEYRDYAEKIRVMIAKNNLNYSFTSGTGNVGLVFELTAQGKLKKVSVDKNKTTASDGVIREAIKSLKKTVPFPVFPPGLRAEYDSLDFYLVISYEK